MGLTRPPKKKLNFKKNFSTTVDQKIQKSAIMYKANRFMYYNIISFEKLKLLNCIII